MSVGAQLMNNLAELSIRGKQTDEKRAQAIAWAQQGLATIERTKAAGGSAEELWLCEQALAAVLFNLGSLHEVGKPSCSSSTPPESKTDERRDGQVSRAVQAKPRSGEKHQNARGCDGGTSRPSTRRSQLQTPREPTRHCLSRG